MFLAGGWWIRSFCPQTPSLQPSTGPRRGGGGVQRWWVQGDTFVVRPLSSLRNVTRETTHDTANRYSTLSPRVLWSRLYQVYTEYTGVEPRVENVHSTTFTHRPPVLAVWSKEYYRESRITIMIGGTRSQRKRHITLIQRWSVPVPP